MIIGIDFDGTCVTHEYPKVGRRIGAERVLKKLVDKGHRLMLWTMRGNKPQDKINTLQDAIEWFKKNEIPLWGINENPEQKESGWSNSNKQYAALYIDDAAIGCPVIYKEEISDRNYADWNEIEQLLIKQGIL